MNQRIGILSHLGTDEYAGWQMQSINLAQFLKRENQVTLICPSSSRADLSHITNKFINKFGSLMRTFFILINKKSSFDIIYCANGYKWTCMVALLMHVLKLPYVLRICTNELELADLVKDWIKLYAYRKSKVLIVLNSKDEELAKKYGINAKKISNPVDINRFTPIFGEEKFKLRSEMGIANESICIMLSGIVCDRKNSLLMLKMINKAVEYVENPISLIMIGPWSGTTESDETYIEKCKVQFDEISKKNSVVQVSFTKSIERYYQAADVFLFLSKEEGSPNSLIEAMSSGLTCVASNISGNMDLIEHKISGFILDLDSDIEKLTNDFCEILNVNTKKVKENARAFCVKNLNKEDVYKTYQNLLLIE
jgi:glycosyltransferase involved in cell wall biosynthesis